MRSLFLFLIFGIFLIPLINCSEKNVADCTLLAAVKGFGEDQIQEQYIFSYDQMDRITRIEVFYNRNGFSPSPDLQYFFQWDSERLTNVSIYGSDPDAGTFSSFEYKDDRVLENRIVLDEKGDTINSSKVEHLYSSERLDGLVTLNNLLYQYEKGNLKTIFVESEQGSFAEGGKTYAQLYAFEYNDIPNLLANYPIFTLLDIDYGLSPFLPNKNNFVKVSTISGEVQVDYEFDDLSNLSEVRMGNIFFKFSYQCQ